MRYLKLFHRDVLTVRSHQWKYYVEPYSGCALQCTYCLYWDSPAFVQRLQPPDDLLEAVDRDLAAMPRKQIIYIGATIDPYQMLEKKSQATRRLLERLVERELPVVVDEEYLDLVRALWDDGQLFENTRIGNDFIDGERVYFRTDRLQLTRNSVLAWD